VSFVDAFAGRRVLLTGHTGFKGSWLALWLERLGASVTGLALDPPTDPSNFAVADVAGSLAADHRLDVRDLDAVAKVLADAAPEVVFHLAAQSLVRESYQAPLETFDVNVVGTATVCEAVRRRGQPCVVVVVSSDKCYENLEQGRPFVEDDPMGGRDPYSASKGATELVVASYRSSFFDPARVDQHGVRLASARAGNAIGGGDWTPDGIVADTVRALAAGRPVQVRNPAAIRPWQHLLEPLSGYLTLAARLLSDDPGRFCRGWNFGPAAGDQATVRELEDRFLATWGGGSWLDCSDADQPPEANVLRLGIGLARRELDWHPRWSLDEAIQRTVGWYRRYYDGGGAGMREATLEDIAAYEQAAPRKE
jgi:CDP-glucose 4,6-dehydratase